MSTDGASAMMGKRSALVCRLKKNVLMSYSPTACCINTLLQPKPPENLKSVMNSLVTVVYFIHSCALNHHLFKQPFEGMGTAHTHLLYHTEVHWVSRGQVLYRVSSPSRFFIWLQRTEIGRKITSVHSLTHYLSSTNAIVFGGPQWIPSFPLVLGWEMHQL